ncbi:DUF222 domain-containing protein [Phycicoccus endophyticus]|uniref:DUF222 domain-containing protein n=1 Tax=Phycicoccus endophyticus TaxID=1690220 RepID=A0A7G9R3A5_9MICO|nr:DUF222 domain-containing protein [Phycicoccus endophyticus]NHI19827.1 DUF222 domain-containing protein [Phycicoccus endophyticus]QNN50080.1 DUF222 domain-containing protein [Phycicoccus endophyticus]GGL28254.1 HNH endonuclease [Phycicoccus endophyticus]
MDGSAATATERPPAGAGVARVRRSLAAVDLAALTDRERLELVTELERLKGAACALQARAVEEVRASQTRDGSQGARRGLRSQDARRSLGSQVALARRESPVLGDRFVGLSHVLVHEMPATMRALEQGLVGERHVLEVVRETATLSREHRAVVDERVAPLLPRLGWRSAGRAAQRVAAELDAAGVVRRMERAVASRRVTVRPAPDGMAYLTVLGPLRDVVGAQAALQVHARAVAGGRCADEAADGRAAGAVAADTALRLLSGRARGTVTPVEVQLVMTDRALLGTGDPLRSPMEPGRVPGHGPVPAPVGRAWVRAAGAGAVWVRRLYTAPGGRDLVAMDSRRRGFSGLLRRLLVLRDDVCSTPWCDAAIVHADHTHPVRAGGPTSLANGAGRCARCNQVKEAPGWRVHVVRGSPLELELVDPTGRRHRSQAPPLLGWGSDPPPGTSALESHLAALLDAA